MGAKTKVTVSLDADLVGALESVSRRTGKPRSRLVEEALRLPMTTAPRRGEVWFAATTIVAAVDKSRLQRRLGVLPVERLDAVDAAIRVSLAVG